MRRKLMRVLWVMAWCAAGRTSIAQGEDATPVAVPVAHRFAGRPVEWNVSQLPAGEGVAVTFSRLDYLISEVRLERTNGTEVGFPGQTFLLSAADGRTTVTLAGVPEGPWKSLSFLVGLNAETNHGDPARWPAGHALNPLENNLHWDWKGGYVFLAAEGRMTGPPGTPAAFLHHLAGDSNVARVKIPLNPVVADLRGIQLVFHLDRLWGGVAPVRLGDKTNVTHSREGDDVAPRLVRNLESCFEVECRGQ